MDCVDEEKEMNTEAEVDGQNQLQLDREGTIGQRHWHSQDGRGAADATQPFINRAHVRSCRGQLGICECSSSQQSHGWSSRAI